MNDEIYDKIYLAIEKSGKYKDYRVSYAMDNPLDDIALEGKVKIIFDGIPNEPAMCDNPLSIPVKHVQLIMFWNIDFKSPNLQSYFLI